MDNENDDKLCPICFENFDFNEKLPKKLKCQHVICLKCLEKMLIYKYVKCPFCNNEIECRPVDLPNEINDKLCPICLENFDFDEK